MSVNGDTAQRNASQSPSCPETTFWGAAVGAIGSDSGVAGAGTLAAREHSSADFRLLQSLDAKIKEMTEAAGAPRSSGAPVPAAPERAVQTVTAVRTTGRSLALTATAPIDSTQTVRPLTLRELEAGEASRWFAIELMLSADQIDARQVPNLGIFEEYKLYSVATPEQGRLMQALRIGFFSSQIAATAVLRYLTGYFPAATLKRVSIAERERFADKLITAGKDIGACGQRLAIELSAAAAARGNATSSRSPSIRLQSEE
jgi:hypothetical protein